jgi:hypothetical protein
MTTELVSHLQACRLCENRLSDLTTQLDEMPEVADAAFEEAITPQRLQAQRVRIAHRLAQLVGTEEPARVIAFPFSGRPLRQLRFSPGRWLAGAVAAGLLVGVTAGQLIHYHPVETQTVTVDETTDDTPRFSSELAGQARSQDMTGTVDVPPPSDTIRPAGSPLAAMTLDEFEELMAEDDDAFLGSLDLALTSFQVSELESIDALTPRVRDLSINVR